MSKFFVISDIHGFYDQMIEALNEAGFDKDNPDHILVSLGDNFDRGDKNVDVMNYLIGLPRKIMVKGNHESLLLECCFRGFPQSHDFGNGTVKTINEFGGAKEGTPFDECCEITLAKTKEFIGQMVNFFETQNYIFVHSYPVLKRCDDMPRHYTRGRVFEYDPNWRNADDRQWEDSMWGNPFALHEIHGKHFDKTIVCGHWDTSWAWMRYHGTTDEIMDECFDPYYMDGLIGIDAMTAYSGMVNVLVLEDELFFSNCK